MAIFKMIKEERKMTAKEFVEEMVKNEELTQKMADCKKPEEAYEIAKEAGVTDDYDAFVKYMTELNEQMSQELSDDELENAAGGLSTSDAITIAGMAVSVATAIASAF